MERGRRLKEGLDPFRGIGGEDDMLTPGPKENQCFLLPTSQSTYRPGPHIYLLPP